MNNRYYRGKGEYIFEYMRKFDARDKYTIFKTIGIDEKYIQKEEIWYMEWFRFVMI